MSTLVAGNVIIEENQLGQGERLKTRGAGGSYSSVVAKRNIGIKVV